MGDPLHIDVRFTYQPSTGRLYSVEVRESVYQPWKPVEFKSPPTIVFPKLPDEAARRALGTAVLAELKPILPPHALEAFAEADALLDVVAAKTTAELTDALIGLILRAMVAALFHGLGMSAVVPIIGLFADLLGGSDDSRPDVKIVKTTVKVSASTRAPVDVFAPSPRPSGPDSPEAPGPGADWVPPGQERDLPQQRPTPQPGGPEGPQPAPGPKPMPPPRTPENPGQAPKQAVPNVEHPQPVSVPSTSPVATTTSSHPSPRAKPPESSLTSPPVARPAASMGLETSPPPSASTGTQRTTGQGAVPPMPQSGAPTRSPLHSSALPPGGSPPSPAATGRTTRRVSPPPSTPRPLGLPSSSRPDGDRALPPSTASDATSSPRPNPTSPPGMAHRGSPPLSLRASEPADKVPQPPLQSPAPGGPQGTNNEGAQPPRSDPRADASAPQTPTIQPVNPDANPSPGRPGPSKPLG